MTGPLMDRSDSGPMDRGQTLIETYSKLTFNLAFLLIITFQKPYL